MSLTDVDQEPGPPRKSKLQGILPYTTVALIIAALYVGWTFYSRYESRQKAESALQQQKQEQLKQTVQQIYGSGEVRFLAFRTDSSMLKRGETTQLCYGVVNAKTVTLDPPVEAAKPTSHHCVEVAPKTTTTYTITAKDEKGNSKSHSLTIHVQ